jgi:hypothetical protein
MQLPRFTLRRLMVIVAIAAIGLGLEVGRRHREGFRALEIMHQTKMVAFRQMSDQYASMAKTHHERAEKIRAGFFLYWPKATVLDGLASLLQGDADGYQAIADHHDRMRQKYRQAAWLPFWPAEPDPPPPANPDD